MCQKRHVGGSSVKFNATKNIKKLKKTHLLKQGPNQLTLVVTCKLRREAKLRLTGGVCCKAFINDELKITKL